MQDQPKIKVVIRKRPISKKQLGKGQNDIIDVRHGNTVTVRENKIKVDLTKYIQEQTFTFDQAFGQSSTNQQIYYSCVKPLIDLAFKGARVTCFAYGQTGSGKTYTMNGDVGMKVPGLYVLGGLDIFNFMERPQFQHLGVYVSFFQIYCGKLFDLLNDRTQLQARQDSKQNVNIIGLQQRRIQSSKHFLQILEHGSSVRVTSSNSQNSDSSRSHAILQISLRQKKHVFGKISFIDLAGCQRGSDTDNSSKQTRIDGAQINKSLLALKQCIRALDQGKNHTPFRGSKLTMVLKDSFVGFCRTLMIGNVSPSSSSCQYTLNTLRYADRVKQLKKGGGGGDQQISKQDILAKQLMLPRMQKNAKRVVINSDDQQQIQLPSVNRKMITQQQNGRPVLFPSAGRGSTPQRNDKPPILPFPQQRKIKNKQKQVSSSKRRPNSKHIKNSSQCMRNYPLKDIQNNQNGHNIYNGIFQQNQIQHPRNLHQLRQLNQKNQKMIQCLFQQQNDLIQAHRNYLKNVVGNVRAKTILLDQVSQSGMQVKQYVHRLEGLIDSQLGQLQLLKSKVVTLKRNQQRQSQFQQRVVRFNSDLGEQSLLDGIQCQH